MAMVLDGTCCCCSCPPLSLFPSAIFTPINGSAAEEKAARDAAYALRSAVPIKWRRPVQFRANTGGGGNEESILDDVAVDATLRLVTLNSSVDSSNVGGGGGVGGVGGGGGGEPAIRITATRHVGLDPSFVFADMDTAEDVPQTDANQKSTKMMSRKASHRGTIHGALPTKSIRLDDVGYCVSRRRGNNDNKKAGGVDVYRPGQFWNAMLGRKDGQLVTFHVIESSSASAAASGAEAVEENLSRDDLVKHLNVLVAWHRRRRRGDRSTNGDGAEDGGRPYARMDDGEDKSMTVSGRNKPNAQQVELS